uniref:Alpha 1,4-glycosyltransferase domain-containing protein n=1 Tax=Alexandrium andersonii TaxID=327968 RepID=A0A7S2AVZ1_9DINO
MDVLRMLVILPFLLCRPSDSIHLGNGYTDLPAIPKVVYVTASYPKGSPEQKQTIRKLVIDRGLALEYFDDDDRRASAELISKALEEEGIVSSAYEAYASLRPFAYKADLWRYMILWHRGGVYVDANMQLLDDLATWVDFDVDELVLVGDQSSGRYWNGMIAARPRSPALAAVIRDVVHNVLKRSYGGTDLDITGPEALSRSLMLSGAGIGIRADYRLREEAQGACGGYPNPPCKVNIYNFMDGSVLAKKARMAYEAVHDHYSKLYRMHAVYCDEPGPPCA